MGDELATLDATAQAALVSRGEVKPAELVDAAIERIERLDSQLGTVVVPLFEKARARATQVDVSTMPFAGVPILVKDSLPTAGDPCLRGMRFLRDRDWREREDAEVVRRCSDAGFVVVGKSNLPELEFHITTEPTAFWPCRNPWDPSYSVGASSGGSGAAVAAGLVPAALAVDGGGSIRIPASLCGLVGLKPSRGRTSATPEYNQEGFNTVIGHMITRSVRDTAATLDAISGVAVGDRYQPPAGGQFASHVGADPGSLRIGVWTHEDSRLSAHEDCLEAVRVTVEVLEDLGHRVEPSFPAVLDDGVPPSFFANGTAWVAGMVDHLSRVTGEAIGEGDLEPDTWAANVAGASLSACDLMRCYREMSAFARRFASWWDSGFDVLLTPTLAVRPFKLGGGGRGEQQGDFFEDLTQWIAFTPAFNISGLPAISLPMHWNEDGMPIGVQLGAALGREDMLIRLASQLEQARPWSERRPPIHA